MHILSNLGRVCILLQVQPRIELLFFFPSAEDQLGSPDLRSVRDAPLAYVVRRESLCNKLNPKFKVQVQYFKLDMDSK